MEINRISYVDCINNVILHSKIDLVDQICVSVYSFTSMFKMLNQAALKLEPQVHANTKQNAVRNKVWDTISKGLDTERKKLQSDIVSEQPLSTRVETKQGFLFKQNSVWEWLLRYVII